MMTKVLDLRKEIQERKREEKIPTFLEGIKFNPEKDNTEKVVKQIEKKIVLPLLEKERELPFEERSKNFLKNINGTSAFNVIVKPEVSSLLESVLKGRGSRTHKNNMRSDNYKSYGPIHVTIMDQTKDISFRSLFSYPVPKACFGENWGFRGASSDNRIRVNGFSKEMSKLLLIKTLNEYLQGEAERREFALLMALSASSRFSEMPNKKIFDAVKEKAKKYHIELNPPAFVLEQWEKEEKMLESVKKTALERGDIKDTGYEVDEFIQSPRPTNKEAKEFAWLIFHPEEPVLSLDNCYWWSYEESVSSLQNGFGLIRYDRLVRIALEMLVEDEKEIEASAKQQRNQSTTYAGVLDEKKNIPEKTKEKMKSTKFLDYFGYVQIDESVDLEKIDQVEAEFFKFANFFGLSPNKKLKLGFRRLGKYNTKHFTVGGLYFPSAKYVIVDVKSPGSFIHEMFHALDDSATERMKLSSMYRFKHIVRSYRDLTNKEVNALPDDDLFKIAWGKGGDKSLSSYFHTPTEIFARCGEIYVREMLGFDNSLVNYNKESLVYPKDEEFRKNITEYFEEVFGKVEEPETPNVAAGEFISGGDPEDLAKVFNEGNIIVEQLMIPF